MLTNSTLRTCYQIRCFDEWEVELKAEDVFRVVTTTSLEAITFSALHATAI